MKTAMRICTTAVMSVLLAGLADVATASAVPGQGTWETALQARDLDGDTITDASNETALNIT